jgi:hypothetical protein
MTIHRPVETVSWLMRCQNKQYWRVGDLIESASALMSFMSKTPDVCLQNDIVLGHVVLPLSLVDAIDIAYKKSSGCVWIGTWCCDNRDSKENPVFIIVFVSWMI